MTTETKPQEGELLDSMPTEAVPVPVPAPTQAMAVTDNPYMAMAQMAMQQGKVAEMRELMAMHKEWDAHQAFKAYVDAMAAFKAEPMEILKRKKVSFETRDGDTTSYMHAELSDVTAVVVPALGKHGLSHRWDVKQEGGSITVTCILTHRLGHSESVTLTAAPDSSGKKNAIQQVASTVTYLERYTLLMATGMATTGMDDDGRTGEPVPELTFITEEQELILRDLMEAYVTNQGEFFKWITGAAKIAVTKLSEIPADTYEIVHGQLKRLRDKKLGAK